MRSTTPTWPGRRFRLAAQSAFVPGELSTGPVFSNDAWFARLLAPRGNIAFGHVREAVGRLSRMIHEVDSGAARPSAVDPVMGASAHHYDNPGVDVYFQTAMWCSQLLRYDMSLRIVPCDEYGNEVAVDYEPSK